MSVLWNTNESEWRVLTLSRFFGSACQWKPRPFGVSHPYARRRAAFLSVSEQYSEVLARHSSSVAIWLSNHLIIFCAWSGRSITSAVPSKCLSYPHSRILVGHDFKCMQLKSVGFFLFPLSVFNHPSSLFYIFKKKTKYINITCKCCKFCSPTREKAVNCSSRHSPKLIKLLYNDSLAMCLSGVLGSA